MIDGILDLLSAIMVLGIVVAVAFGFIMPLTRDDLMQYSSQYEDKATITATDDYSTPTDKNTLPRRKYSYEELVLLMSVQDSRMGAPKAINMRNLVTAYNLRDKSFNTVNLNEIATANDRVLQGLQYFSENPTNLIDHTFPTNKKNIGTVKFDEYYDLHVDDFCSMLMRSDLGLGGNLQLSEKRYFITYQYAVKDSLLVGTPDYQRNYDEQEVYMVQIDGNWKKNSSPINTLALQNTYLDLVSAAAHK